MTLEQIFELVMVLFGFALVWSYMTLAITKGVRDHLHTSCMIWSYVILLAIITTYTPYKYDDWRIWPLGFALFLGMVGLVQYYRAKLVI